MASQTRLPLTNEGKISKAQVLLQIMREEEGAGRELDIDRIVRIARDRIAKAAPDLQPEKEVNREDYRSVLPRFHPSGNGRAPTLPAPQQTIPLNQGRVSKSHLLAQIIREEQEAGRTLDGKKILLIAQKRLEQFPPGQQPGSPLQQKDYANALRRVKGLPPYGTKKPKEKPTPPQQTPVETSKSIDLSDLMAAKLFVSKYCEGDITRAEAIFSALNALMKEWSK